MTTATPSLKPWPYYRAVDLLERARMARRRYRPTEMQTGVRILAYHRVAAQPDPLAVRPDAFRRQMEAILSQDARVVGLNTALELLVHPVTDAFICVTFDDGYLDTLEIAAPIMRDLRIPATVFLPTAMIDGRAGYDWYRRSPPPALTWDDVAALIDDGLIDVGSHSRSHARLPALDDDAARDELAGSKADIESRLRRPVTAFCYPAGLYCQRDARLVHEVGYHGAVTCRSGLNRGGEPLAELRRTLIGWADDAHRFEAKLAGQLDEPSRLTEAMQRRRAGRRIGRAVGKAS
jgi:peptidoglycan/xylan/chitin deacetylase (PgdA/CDA1 family)